MDRSTSRGNGPDDERGLSPVIGVVILIGLATIGALVIFMTATQFQQGAKSEQKIKQTEEAMRKLNSEVGQLSLNIGNKNSEIGFPTGGTAQVKPDAGATITVTLNDNSQCSVELKPGRVTYTVEKNTFVYEAGGIWRITESGGTKMVSAPGIGFENGTLDLSVVFVKGNIVDAQGFKATRKTKDSKEKATNAEQSLLAQSGREYPARGGPCRPRESVKLEITSSDFAKAWTKHLKNTMPDGSVDRNGDTVTVDLNPDVLAETDSDDDGVLDSEDNCPKYFNPRQGNRDLRNDAGQLATSADVGSTETESDPQGNVCDSDDDGDGIGDYVDASSDSGNPPGLYSGTDWGMIRAPYFAEDTVGGMTNKGELDNCPQTYNPGSDLDGDGEPEQADLDGDGMGNACDPDPDGDGRETRTINQGTDRGDECDKTYNPAPNDLSADTDEIPNACDPDDDGDGYPDFGYFTNKSADQRFYNRTLFRDPGGNHTYGLVSGTPLKPTADNCPKTPNDPDNNYDRNNRWWNYDEKELRNMTVFRGDACDMDMDDDGLLNKMSGGAGSGSDFEEFPSCRRDSNNVKVFEDFKNSEALDSVEDNWNEYVDEQFGSSIEPHYAGGWKSDGGKFDNPQGSHDEDEHHRGHGWYNIRGTHDHDPDEDDYDPGEDQDWYVSNRHGWHERYTSESGEPGDNDPNNGQTDTPGGHHDGSVDMRNIRVRDSETADRDEDGDRWWIPGGSGSGSGPTPEMCEDGGTADPVGSEFGAGALRYTTDVNVSYKGHDMPGRFHPGPMCNNWTTRHAVDTAGNDPRARSSPPDTRAVIGDNSSTGDDSSTYDRVTSSDPVGYAFPEGYEDDHVGKNLKNADSMSEVRSTVRSRAQSDSSFEPNIGCWANPIPKEYSQRKKDKPKTRLVTIDFNVVKLGDG